MASKPLETLADTQCIKGATWEDRRDNKNATVGIYEHGTNLSE